MKISNAPTIQHYVPQFLLKNFSFGSKPQVYVFDKFSGKSFISHTKNIACERYFYNYIDDVNQDLKTLETSLSSLESKTTLILQKIIERKELRFLTSQETYELASYVASQFLRTKALRANTQHTMQELALELFESGVKEIEGFCDEDTLRTVSCNLISKHLPIFITEFLNKDWFLIANETEQYFLTSDNPVVMYNENQDSLLSTLGISVDGIQIYLPINPTLTIAIFCKSLAKQLSNIQNNDLLKAIKEKTCWSAPKESVTFLNELQIIFSERYLFSNHRDFSLVENKIHTYPSYKKGPRSSIS